MQIILIVSALILALSVVFAQQLLQGQYVIYYPAQGQSFSAGSSAQFQWGVSSTPQIAVKTSNIDLVYGDANNAAFMMNIVTGLDASKTSYTWNIPTSITPRSDYFLKFTSIAEDGTRAYSFSVRFAVTGGSGTSGAKSDAASIAKPLAIVAASAGALMLI